MSRLGHPSADELLVMAKFRNGQSDLRWRRHVDHCFHCQQRLARLRPVLAELDTCGSLNVGGGDHLSDDAIAAYVHAQLTASEQTKVEAHLQECGACLKEVLRTRAHIASRFQVSTKGAESAKTHRLRSATRKNWTTWGAALAAGLAALVLVPWLTELDWKKEPTFDVSGGDIALRAGVEQRARTVPETDVVPTTNSATRRVASAPSHGTIDWYNGFVETTATGTVDMTQMKNPVQAEIVAEKTARHLAYAQLAEVLDGVRVTEDTTYQDLLLRVSALKIATEGFIRGAQVVRKSVEWVSGVPRASVTLRAPLSGTSGLSTVLKEHWPGMNIDRATETEGQTKPSPRLQRQVVVDARGLNYEPALQLRVTAPSNRILAAGWLGARANAPEVVYRHDIEEALNNTSAGAKPLVVRAISGTPGRLVVDESGAKALSQVLRNQSGKLPEQMTVVF